MNSHAIEVERETEFEWPVYSKRGLSFVKGRGEFLYDSDGREYIDCVAGHGVAMLGHSHPAIVHAIRKQAEFLVSLSSTFSSEARASLLERLSCISPIKNAKSFLCNSGTEAVEAALKLARVHTKKKGFIAAMNSFHGRTAGSLSLTYKPAYREPFLPLLGPVKHVHYGNAEELRASIDSDTAAVVLEPIQGEGGIRIPSSDYFRQVREICDEKGVLLIADEIQTGLGRTGKMFAVEHSGVVPDIITLAKPLAGGIPMGVAIARREVADSMKTGQHGSTFGGNPLACAVALAVLDAIENEGLVEKAASDSTYFLGKLKQLEQETKSVREVRGKGMMIAVELKSSLKENAVLSRLAERGLLAFPAGDMVIRMLPPLVIQRASMDRAASILSEVLA